MDKKKLENVYDGLKGDFYLIAGCYSNNKRLYLGLEIDDELCDDITINLTNVDPYFKDVVFLDMNLTEGIKDMLKHNGILGEYYYTQQYNMGQFDCYTINLDKVKEFDPKGFAQYEKLNGLEDEYSV